MVGYIQVYFKTSLAVYRGLPLRFYLTIYVVFIVLDLKTIVLVNGGVKYKTMKWLFASHTVIKIR